MHYLTQRHGWPDAGFAVFRLPRLAQPAPITISLAQMQELLSKTFDSTIQGFKWATIRDRIVLGCFAAIRYSDLNRLQWQNIIERNGKTWLEYQSKKTGMRTKILLPIFLREMIMKYKTRRTKTIFPRISNVNLNKQVKRLGKYLNWDENTPVYKSCNGILKLERVEKLYRLLTTHTMRRTGISLMLQLGMPENIVRKISGHAPNSKEFYRYIHVAQDWQDEETEKVHQSILPNSI
jgi:integrase